MIDFVKYPSIENSYREKYLGYMKEKYPDIERETFVLQEKVDGANFQTLITKYAVLHSKRNSVLNPGDKFYGWEEVVNEYDILYRHIQYMMEGEGWDSVRLYGEIYGGSIQNRIAYSKDKKICYYDMIISVDGEEKWSTPRYFRESMDSIAQILDSDPMSIRAPEVDLTFGLKDALNVSLERDTLLSDGTIDGDKQIEGYVIKPWENVYLDGNGSPFRLKMKNEKFMDGGSPKKLPKELPEHIQTLRTAFSEYLNENRVKDYFSKVGEIESEKQIGEYLSGITKDAIEDFKKDWDKFGECTKEEQKMITKIGGHILIPILRKYL